MRGMLIDPYKRTVEALESEFENQELHRLVGAETLGFCHPYGRTETLAVDDEGMAQKLPEFYIEGYQWPIWGRAVLFGRGTGGQTVSTHLSVEAVYDSIAFTYDPS